MNGIPTNSTTTNKQIRKESVWKKRILSKVNHFCCDNADGDGITEDVEESTERASSRCSGLEGKRLEEEKNPRKNEIPSDQRSTNSSNKQNPFFFFFFFFFFSFSILHLPSFYLIKKKKKKKSKVEKKKEDNNATYISGLGWSVVTRAVTNSVVERRSQRSNR